MIQTLGSIASMLGLVISSYVLWRELRLQKDVTALKQEEESWHENCPRRGIIGSPLALQAQSGRKTLGSLSLVLETHGYNPSEKKSKTQETQK